jgi:hypothetical protein
MRPLRCTLACAGFHRVQTLSPPVMTSTSESVAIAIRLWRVTTLAPDRPYSRLAGTLGLEAGDKRGRCCRNQPESSSGPRRKRTCPPYLRSLRTRCTGLRRRRDADNPKPGPVSFSRRLATITAARGGAEGVVAAERASAWIAPERRRTEAASGRSPRSFEEAAHRRKKEVYLPDGTRLSGGALYSSQAWDGRGEAITAVLVFEVQSPPPVLIPR